MATFPITNAPQVHDLNRFRAVLNKYGGLANACRFAVFINLPRTMLGDTINQDLVFLCEQAELPGKAMNVQEARYYGPNFKYPVQSVYNDVTMNFIVRDEMLEKQFFDNWLWTINPTDHYDFQYKDDYCTTIDIIQYSAGASESGGSYPTYKVSLLQAWPIAVEPMQMVWGEENFHRISVQFAFDQWTRVDFPESTEFALVEGKTANPTPR